MCVCHASNLQGWLSALDYDDIAQTAHREKLTCLARQRRHRECLVSMIVKFFKLHFSLHKRNKNASAYYRPPSKVRRTPIPSIVQLDHLTQNHKHRADPRPQHGTDTRLRESKETHTIRRTNGRFSCGFSTRVISGRVHDGSKV